MAFTEGVFRKSLLTSTDVSIGQFVIGTALGSDRRGKG